MPSSLSRRLSKSLRRASLRSSKRSSSIYDSTTSISSDTSTLLSVEFPHPKFQTRIEVIDEDDVLDPEDQAWGPPPSSPSIFNLSLPTFLRRNKLRDATLG